MAETIHNPTPSEQLPFAAPYNILPVWSALDWLALAWQDFKHAPGISLLYGSILVVISYALAIASWYLGGVVLLFSLLSGLVFIAPVLAMGLYSISCQISAGYKPKLTYCMREGKRHIGNEMVFSVILLIVFLVWTKAGSGVHIFFPMQSNPEFLDYLIFYFIGGLIGSIFAVIVFCASAFSLPMMMDRKSDTVTAVITSVNAVINNKKAMLVWLSIVVLGVIICLATAFLAMPLIMPLLGYATWHGYKQTINAGMWRKNQKLNDDHPFNSRAMK